MAAGRTAEEVSAFQWPRDPGKIFFFRVKTLFYFIIENRFLFFLQIFKIFCLIR